MIKWMILLPFIISCAHLMPSKKMVCANVADASRNSKSNYNVNDMQICRLEGTEYRVEKKITEKCKTWTYDGKVNFTCNVSKETTMSMGED